ncbi:DUF2157 domain-containing protein [Gammaproteobacteria bacterium]
MLLNRAFLKEATENGIITAQQAEQLFNLLQNQHSPEFRTSNVLYYFGGMIAIGAMSLFMTLGWETFGGMGLFTVSVTYALIGIFLTEFFLKRKELYIPAGISATFSVVLTPLAVYGLQVAMGAWAEGRVYRDYHVWIDWRWVLMEFSTLASGAIFLWRYSLPFLVMPVAVTLWYMSMDLAPFLFEDSFEWRAFVSIWFGLLMIVIALWVDLRTKKTQDFAFWLYLFGVLAFWGGLSSMNSDSELNKFFYLCINVGMILIGAMLSRRVFTVFGGFGAAGYIGHLAYGMFKDSLLFPFVLTVLGFGIVFFGVFWQRHEESFNRQLKQLLPKEWQELLDRE